MQSKINLIDKIIILLLPILAAIISFIFHVNAFWSVLLFFVVPSIYLSFRSPKQIKRILTFSAFASVPVIIMVDYIAHVSRQWLIPHSVLHFRMFGLVTIEVIIWALFNFYFVIIFYKHFLDRAYFKKLLPSRMLNMLILIVSLMIAFIVTYIFAPEKLNIPYFYLWFGLIIILIPIVIEFSQYPKVISKFFITACYFFYVSFLYEVTALKLDWWLFPNSTFIGQVNIFGVNFPFEEMFFWLILFSMACLTAFERFDESS